MALKPKPFVSETSVASVSMHELTALVSNPSSRWADGEFHFSIVSLAIHLKECLLYHVPYFKVFIAGVLCEVIIHTLSVPEVAGCVLGVRDRKREMK